MSDKQPALSNSARRPFTKEKERIQKFKETGVLKIYFSKRTR